MDNSIKNNKKLFGYENRWNRIEKKHINSIKLGHRDNVVNSVYKNMLKSKTFVNERHMKMMSGEDCLKQWCLDPNLVMDIRHENVSKKKAQKENSLSSNLDDTKCGFNNGVVYEDKEYVERMQYLNGEIDRFRSKIQDLRPKPTVSNDKWKTQYSKCNEIKTVDCDSKTCNVVKPYVQNGNGFCSQYSVDICYESQKPEKCSAMSEVSYRNFDYTREYQDGCLKSEVVDSLDWYNDDQISTIQINNDCYQDGNNKNGEMKVTLVPKTKEEQIIDNKELVNVPKASLIESNTFVGRPADGNPAKNKCSSNNVRPARNKKKHLFSPGHSIIVSKLEIPNSNLNVMSEKNGLSQNFMENGTERSAIINELFSDQDNRAILKKYFIKWLRFNTIMKLTKQNTSHGRVRKIETFLQNLTLERKRALEKLKAKAYKSKTTNVNCETKTKTWSIENPELLTKKYNNKIKIQQDIIELQRIKLQRQQRLITELKFSKLMEEANDSQANIKQELKQVIKTGCPRSRSKARCLQVTSNLRDIQDDEEYTDIQAKGLQAPKFLIEMQARAMEREMKHRQAKERREYLEWEKEQLRLASDEAKRLQDEDAKRKRIEELRRKRREEKQRKIQQELQRQKYLEDLERVKRFHRIKLLKYALKSFTKLIEIKRHNEQIANELNCRLIKQRHFKLWKDRVRKIWNERKNKADNLCKQLCLRRTILKWQQYYTTERSKRLLAEDWYNMKLSERVLRIWSCLTAQTRLMFEIKMKQAELHYEWNLKWKVLDHWRRLRAILRIERETEMRRQKWRNKISEILPDYNPVRDGF